MTAHTMANAHLAPARRLLLKYMEQAQAASNGRRKALGERISIARKEKRWKQKQLAAAVNVEPMTVSRWERGQHAPDVDMLELIAQATGQPLTFFLPETPGLVDADAEFQREIRGQLADLVASVQRLEARLGGEEAPQAAAESR